MENNKDIVSVSEELLSLGEETHYVIKIHQFKNEEEQHDDELIDSVINEFTVNLKNLASLLSEKYGPAKIIDDSDDFDEEDEFNEFEDEEFCVPGSFSSAVWESDEFILYLAVCQEDREYPISLVIGVTY